MNSFLKSVTKSDTFTDNGAISNSSTGSTLADQFGVAGAQRGRTLEQVFADQSKLHRQYGLIALKFVFYLRLITRKVKYQDKTTEKVQKGQGNRDEAFKRLLWYALNEPDLFYNNLWILKAVGSYKDYFDILFLAEQNKIQLDVKRILQEALDEESDLCLKYLPLPIANSKATTARSQNRNKVAKSIAGLLGLSYLEMRKLKSSGKAHGWQQLISRQLFGDIEFHKISGKALTNLVTSKFLAHQGLEEKYQKWIQAQPVAKFTGYVYELGNKVQYNNKPYIKMTLDKQFDGLLKLGQDGGLGNRKVISAIDTSSSMLSNVMGGTTTCMNVAIALGVYFSSLMEGEFKDWVIRFSSKSQWAKLIGTFSEKYLQIKNFNDYPSSTDFQSVIDSIVKTRVKNPDVPETDFPNTLLVVSDMQFDNSSSKTNYELAKQKLSSTFSKEYVDRFLFIWWQVNGNKKDYPQTLDEPGGYIISGFDGSIVSLILGGEEKVEGKKPSMDDMIKEALSQEVLTWVE